MALVEDIKKKQTVRHNSFLMWWASPNIPHQKTTLWDLFRIQYVFLPPMPMDASKNFSYAKTASHHQSFTFGSLSSHSLPFSSSSFAPFGFQSSFVQGWCFLSSFAWCSCFSFGFCGLVCFRLSIWSPFVVSTSFLGGAFLFFDLFHLMMNKTTDWMLIYT